MSLGMIFLCCLHCQGIFCTTDRLTSVFQLCKHLWYIVCLCVCVCTLCIYIFCTRWRMILPLHGILQIYFSSQKLAIRILLTFVYEILILYHQRIYSCNIAYFLIVQKAHERTQTNDELILPTSNVCVAKPDRYINTLMSYTGGLHVP